MHVTVVGSVVNLLLLAFKFIAGILGHSSAMIADAVHSLSDFVTDIIILLFVRISGKPEDADHTYGHGKFETLATAIVGLILMAVGLGIFYHGTSEVISVINGHTLPSPGLLALTAALVSIACKEGLYHYTVFRSRALQSQVLRANAWHHRSDALSSIAAAIGIGGAMLFGPHWNILDPIAAILVSFLIIKVAVDLIKPAVNELLEKSLPPDIEHRILEIILSVPGISEPHHLRTRRIGNHFAIEVHIRMNGDTTLTQAHASATEIEHRLKHEFGADTHIGIHMEPSR